MTDLKFKYFKSQIDEAGQVTSGFMLNALENGQAITIGNTLRRVLLSNIPGIAIHAIKIPNIKHEFSTISGLREDVLELILNLKQVIIKSDLKHIQGSINVKGPGIITANCLEFPPDVTIVNPNQYICTLSSKKIFHLDIKASRGKGYSIAKQISYQNLDGYIPIDTVFLPVLRVNCRIKQIGPTESLLIEITTNGSITPEYALNQAAFILVKWFGSLNTKIIMDDEEEEEKNSIIQKDNVISIEELQLPVRAINSLKQAGIMTIADLSQYSEEEILEIRNLGEKLLNKITQALKIKFNIELPPSKNT